MKINRKVISFNMCSIKKKDTVIHNYRKLTIIKRFDKYNINILKTVF